MEKNYEYKVAIIKNIHEHQIDKKGKDTYLYTENGAIFSITKNIYNETTFFIKKEVLFPELLKWILLAPYNIDVVITEGFRNLNYPTILCVKEEAEIKEQLTKNVLILSGLICKKNKIKKSQIDLPCFDIMNNFNEFIKIFHFESSDQN